MLKPTVVQQGEIYHIRFRIGSRQLWLSLKTRDGEQARIRAKQMEAVAVTTAFATRLQPKGAQVSQIREDLGRLVDEWRQAELDHTERAKIDSGGFDPADVEDQTDVYADLLEEAHEALTSNKQWQVKSLADGLVEQHGLKMGRESGEYRRLCRELLKARAALYEEEIRRMDGRYTTVPSVVAPSPFTPPAAVVPSIDLRKSFDSYMSQHTYRRSVTQRDIELTLNEFLKMSGLDWKTVDVRRDCVKATCTKWKDLQLARVAARSFNKKLSYLQHLFRWMVKHDMIEKNPLEGLGVATRQQRVESNARKPFTAEQMRLLLDSLLNTGKKDSRFWCAVLVMHTGMRGGEAFPLCVDQVKEQGGVDYLDLYEDESRELLLKNAASTRKVPVSSALRGLGFVDFVATRRKAGNKARLFPGLSRTWDVSMYVKRAMRRVGIVDPALTLHSTRHFYATQYVRAGVQSEIRHRLLGHSLPGSTQNTDYVELNNLFPLEVLRDAHKKVRF
ncbi:MAG: tyrosine-type recombinase/integrase [Nitrospira sp.]|nr:tyrosine-type recombinase/integrase [Nitrospira sp.]